MNLSVLKLGIMFVKFYLWLAKGLHLFNINEITVKLKRGDFVGADFLGVADFVVGDFVGGRDFVLLPYPLRVEQ